MTDNAEANERFARRVLLAYAETMSSGMAVDHREIANRARARSALGVPLGGVLVILVLIGAVAALTRVPTAGPGSDPARAAVASCAEGDWPVTAISCETAFRIGNQAGARVEQARIWVTTLDAVKASMHPAQQVTEPAASVEVWVIVYDGSWRCCPNAYDENGNLIPQVDQTRWLVVAEAAREGTGFIYLQDWTGKPVPETHPLPIR